jgi:hydroxymethylbilane synthase
MIRIGTRGSKLALWQANHVNDSIKKKYPEIKTEIKVIKTKGDNILDLPLPLVGGKGLFTKEIENALLNDEIDLAVHSLKDLPTYDVEGLQVAAILKREDPNDVLISKNNLSLLDMPEGAVIATGSTRRKALLLHARPDIKAVDIRGNIDTRLKKFDESNWDGIFLAKAGIDRLGYSDRISEVMSVGLMLPAVSQGALAVQIRKDDSKIIDKVSFLNHDDTYHCVSAERSFMSSVEGGCSIPVGAYAEIEGDELHIDAMVSSLNGEKIVRMQLSSKIEDHEKLGTHIAEKLFEMGGREILDQVRKDIEDSKKSL